MKSFTDTEGRSWSIKGSLPAFEKVKMATGVDLLDMPTTQQCLRDMSDCYKLGRVLYALCEEQVLERGLSPEQFACAFNADTLHEASNAIVDEVIFFCRKEVKPMMQVAVEAARKMESLAVVKAREEVAKMRAEMDSMCESLLTSTDFATSSEASLASTQENGHSDNSSGPRRRAKRKAGTIQAR